MGPIGGRGEAAKGQPRAPPPKSELDKEGGGAPPTLFLSPSLSFPLLSYTPTRKGGFLLPVGGGLLLVRPSWPSASPPLLLYIRGQGAP